MEHLFFECAVRATLVIGGTAIVLYAMRVNAPSARHSVWAGVVALMLVLPFWTAWGPKVLLRLLPPLAQSTTNEALTPPGILSTGVATMPRVSIWLAVFSGVYLVGLCLLLLRLAIGTVRARRLVRNAILHDGMHTSSLCAAPVTVGFLHPTVIFPEHWRQWSQEQLDAVTTHECEHARRRDPLVQWLALLNRALFWFHPAAWWLEHHLSALAEESCDNVVLARGHNPREYSEYLVEMARSVTRSGARLNITGMAMPGSSLPRRIRQILKGGSVPYISRMRMGCVSVACAIMCTAFAAGALDHAQQDSSAQQTMNQRESASTAHPATKFVLGDLKIEGDVHDRDGVRDRVLKGWPGREYDDSKQLAGELEEVGIRGDFQERGYFKVLVHEPVVQLLGIKDGKQSILVISTVEEGDQFRLGTFTFQNVPPDHPLGIAAETLRDQFHLRTGDLFNANEIRHGLDRVKSLYGAKGYAGERAIPITEFGVPHVINVTLRITEGPHTK